MAYLFPYHNLEVLKLRVQLVQPVLVLEQVPLMILIQITTCFINL